MEHDYFIECCKIVLSNSEDEALEKAKDIFGCKNSEYEYPGCPHRAAGGEGGGCTICDETYVCAKKIRTYFGNSYIKSANKK